MAYLKERSVTIFSGEGKYVKI